MRSFQASYDVLTKIVSGALLAIAAAVGILTGSALIAAGIVSILGLTFLWSPLGYEIESGVLIVRRPIGRVRIPLKGLREARLAQHDDLNGCIRLFGSGGLFGYFGIFSTTKLGKSTWYCTNRKNLVVLVTENKTIVLSPDDPTGLVAAVGHTPGAVDGVGLTVTATSRVGIVFGALFAAAIVGVVAFAFLYSPGPPAYTLTRAALTIHDRFYPVTVSASDVDLQAVRIVDVSTDPTWRPTARTNGFANPHYASGWFRVAGGEKVRMYRAGGKRLVLLPPKANGAPILYQAADPDAFLNDLRRVW
jgi:hypothetical protein